MPREGNSTSAPPEPGPTAGEAAPEEVSETLIGFGVNAALVAEIRQRYEVDPSSVDARWADLFRQDASAPVLGDDAPGPPAAVELPQSPTRSAVATRLADQHARVLRLIHAYRARGHRIADTNPLQDEAPPFPELDTGHYGFGDGDLIRDYIAGDLPGGTVQSLSQILERLRETYCRKVGVEFTHVQDPGRRTWLQQEMENARNISHFGAEERLRILERLSAAELFERFLHTKFVGQKRFSLEGAEALIPLLDSVVEQAPDHGVQEIVLGMAHRGRLNVLSNILGKSLESIFSEFEDNPPVESPFGSGDVKYHKGFSKDRWTSGGARVHLSLTTNPSHLEAVDPVVEGRARAKQVRAGDETGETILPVLIHGDAAFAGQGIVAETLNLANLPGYSTGGSIHIVVNNQIGFTTTPAEARSTLYCTDVAKMIQVPIFHVNGDDPDAVVYCVKQALAYRGRFGVDVVIDLICYRRHGHNEGDEPSFTQPLLYEKIRRKESVRKIYTEKLLELGILQRHDVERIEEDLSDQLSQALELIETRPPGPDEPYEPRGPWRGFSRVLSEEVPETSVPVERLAQIAERLSTVPPGLAVHPKLEKLLEQRRKVVADSGAIDWGTAEALCFGSLLAEGTAVRLSGQDSTRGTFSQRHASLVDQKTGAEYFPLANLSPTQGRFEVYDSLLSEAAVLGFEYGYSLAEPQTLTLWEAQFGDFVNGAQVIIDQFISSAHFKWQRMSGLVMLLPHGYEGQGPEHSSARIERFLQGCAQGNLQVANCTTPAQYFHLLRRQMRRRYRCPLVIFTPKGLLRAPAATSTVEELARGGFERVIPDPGFATCGAAVRRVVLCSGRLYYDLLEQRGRHEALRESVALVRIEELYPWPGERLAEILGGCAGASEVVWAQEEPANMGAWTFARERIRAALQPHQTLSYAGRSEGASTATGSLRIHRVEQRQLVAAALGLDS